MVSPASRAILGVVRTPRSRSLRYNACGFSTTVETLKHGNTRVEEIYRALRRGRFSTRRGCAFSPLRETNERTNERADDDRSSSRSTFAPTNNFFFLSYPRVTHSVTRIYEHSIATGRCRETEWPICGAHIVLAARSSLVPRRTRSDGSSRLPNINSTDTSSAEGDPRGLSSRSLVRLSEILSTGASRRAGGHVPRRLSIAPSI